MRNIQLDKKLTSNIGALIVLSIFFTLFNRDFIKISNLLDIVRNSSFFGLAALGETLVMIGGGIDLSIGGIACLSAISSAYILENTALDPMLVITIGIMIGVLCGVINAFIVTKTGIPPFIVTLGTMQIFFGSVMVITKGTPIFDIPVIVQQITKVKIAGIAFPIIIFIVLAILLRLFTGYVNVGRNLFSIGGNIEAAKLSGIPVNKTKFIMYTASGLLSGIGGVLALSWLGSGQPTLGSDWLLQVVAATIIGGASLTGGEGKIIGTVTGVLLLGILTNGLTMIHVSPYWRGLFIGAVVILAVYLDVVRNK